MPSYKLTYFNVKGVGEPIRYLFSYSRTPFVDDRIEIDDWAKHKDGKPFGQVPVLDVDGVLLTQSVAVARYLAKTFKLMGETDIQNAQIDGLVDHMQDMHNKLYAGIRQMREAGDACIVPNPIQAFEKDVLPYFLEKFNAAASKGAFYGMNLTWADIYFAGWMDVMETRLKKQLLGNYPNLKALKNRVESSPGVQAYLENRPYNIQ